MRRELISNALNERFIELRGRISQLAPEQFGDLPSFASQLCERMLDASPSELKHFPFASQNESSWFEANEDCVTSLRRLSLGEQLKLRASQAPQLAPFVQALRAAKREPERRLLLLTERYCCPLNFSAPSEAESREYLLAQLMVHVRRRIEQNSINAADSDDLLLRLNLMAVHAAIVPDLRFLDALNYYYELLPAAWRPHARYDSLLGTYFALYAHALAVWI